MRFILLISLFLLNLSVLATDSWQKILKEGKGKVTFYWFPNNVSISKSKDVIDGVEHDLAFAFINYLNAKYELDIEVQWIETESFNTVMTTIKSGKDGLFGASSISITEERKKVLNYTPPYLSDIAVLVSSPDVPIAHTPDEFKAVFQGKTGITIANTTLYDALVDLQKQLDIEFPVDYVSNSGQIIDEIEGRSNGFGYIDLPNFLVSVQNASKIRRQFFYPIKLQGLAMVYPKDSDWSAPVEDYFNSDQFEKDKQTIIRRYFGEDITSVIERISRSADIGPFEEIMISNREKELQYEELLEAARRERESNRTTIILIVIVTVGFFGILLLLFNNRIKTKTNQQLKAQQEMIEQRNQQLNQLNEEKNDLIKVLAHDLRSPLSNIITSSVLLKEHSTLDENGSKMIEFISQSSEKIQSMIEKILDVEAIESGERNMNMEAVDPEGIIKSVLKENGSRAQRKGITLRHEGVSGLKVLADTFYLQQVIENLVSNAIKFSESNTTITVGLYDRQDSVRIMVKDEGPGFSSEDQGNIFKKFHKLTAKPTGGETTVGLGLSIVKSYTEMMGGTISFSTEQGVGTEFYVDLKKVD